MLSGVCINRRNVTEPEAPEHGELRLSEVIHLETSYESTPR